VPALVSLLSSSKDDADHVDDHNDDDIHDEDEEADEQEKAEADDEDEDEEDEESDDASNGDDVHDAGSDSQPDQPLRYVAVEALRLIAHGSAEGLAAVVAALRPAARAGVSSARELLASLAPV
jgi:hypothetical protein